MYKRTRTRAAPGSGGAGTVGNVAWTPGDSAHPPSVGALVGLPSFAIQANDSVGVHPTLISLALGQADTSIGVTAALSGIGINGGNACAGHIANPANAIAGNNSIAGHAANPANAISGGNAIAGHISGTVLGAPFWKTIGTVDGSTSGTSIVIPAPSGIVVGELLFAALGAGSNVTFTAPSGWTSILNTQNGTSTTLETLWKIADSADAAAANFTFTASVSVGFWGNVQRITAPNPSTPINVSAGAVGQAVSPIAPTATTTVVNCLIIIVCVQGSSIDLTYTPPSGYTERADQDGAAILHSLDGATDTKVQAATGATGPQTMTSTALVTAPYSAQTIAIAPGSLIIAS